MDTLAKSTYNKDELDEVFAPKKSEEPATAPLALASGQSDATVLEATSVSTADGLEMAKAIEKDLSAKHKSILFHGFADMLLAEEAVNDMLAELAEVEADIVSAKEDIQLFAAGSKDPDAPKVVSAILSNLDVLPVRCVASLDALNDKMIALKSLFELWIPEGFVKST